MASVNAVADYILAKVDANDGDSITHLKLQKLVYYCQAWYLAYYDELLFDNRIEAWAHGPAVWDLWQRFKNRGWQSIDPTKLVTDPFAELDERQRDMIDEVWAAYGNLSGSDLRALTHSEDPWIAAYGDRAPGRPCDTEITRDSMRDFYRAEIA
jgi:uncharacterized phage-associated protein